MSFITRMLFDSEIARIWAAIKRVQLASPLPNSSVERGAVEIRSAEGLIVDGSAIVNGVERITGNWYLEGIGWVTGTLNIDGLLSIGGTLNVDGTSTFNGDSRFTGSLDVTGPSRFVGSMRVEGPMVVVGNVLFDGDVRITNTLDVTATTRLRGKTTVEDDLDVVRAGKLRIGPILLDPKNHSGSMRWQSGPEILVASGGLELYGAGSYSVQIKPDAVYIPLMERITDAGSVSGLDFVAYTRPSGKLVRVAQDAGSPLGGDLEWPWDPELNTDEYGPRESPGGIGSTFHRGMDFGIGYTEGTDIRVCGRGTVIERGTGSVGGSGFGNFVVVQHPKNQRTLYGHMQSAPTWSVGDVIPKGGFVGKVGNTGASTGAHLHLETHVIVGGAYEPVNPRTVITKPYAA